MPTVSYAGQSVSVNDEGFLTDPGQWTEDIAAQLAEAEGIDELTPRHWQVIRFMRAEYQVKGTAPRSASSARPPASPSRSCTSSSPRAQPRPLSRSPAGL